MGTFTLSKIPIANHFANFLFDIICYLLGKCNCLRLIRKNFKWSKFEIHHLFIVYDVENHFAPYFYGSARTSDSNSFYNSLLPPNRVLLPTLRKNIPQSDCNRRNKKSIYELYKTLFTPLIAERKPLAQRSRRRLGKFL